MPTLTLDSDRRLELRTLRQGRANVASARQPSSLEILEPRRGAQLASLFLPAAVPPKGQVTAVPRPFMS